MGLLKIKFQQDTPFHWLFIPPRTQRQFLMVPGPPPFGSPTWILGSCSSSHPDLLSVLLSCLLVPSGPLHLYPSDHVTFWALPKTGFLSCFRCLLQYPSSRSLHRWHKEGSSLLCSWPRQRVTVSFQALFTTCSYVLFFRLLPVSISTEAPGRRWP